MTTPEENQECENQSGEFKQCLKKGKGFVDYMVDKLDEGLKNIKQCLNFQHCQGFVGCAKDSTGKIVLGYYTKEDLCFDCNHWEELYENRLDSGIIHIRVNGRHYQTALQSINKPPPKYAGFGGRKFVVKIKEPYIHGMANTFYTCDMWTQGTIPEHYKDKLPDNAEFLNEVKETVVYDGEQFITAFDIKPPVSKTEGII